MKHGCKVVLVFLGVLAIWAAFIYAGMYLWNCAPQVWPRHRDRCLWAVLVGMTVGLFLWAVLLRSDNPDAMKPWQFAIFLLLFGGAAAFFAFRHIAPWGAESEQVGPGFIGLGGTASIPIASIFVAWRYLRKK